MVASSVLLDRLPTLWAGLGVGSHPVARLTVAGGLIVPDGPTEQAVVGRSISHDIVGKAATLVISECRSLISECSLKPLLRSMAGPNITPGGAVYQLSSPFSKQRFQTAPSLSHMAQVHGVCVSLPHLKQKTFPQLHSGSMKASPSAWQY